MTTSDKKTRILLVEDHPLVRDGLRSRIDRQEDMEVCGEADDVTEAMSAIQSKDPDIAIVDLSLRSGNGLDLISQLTATESDVRVIVASMHDEHIYAERAVKAGAMGYVHKQEASTKIVEAIRQVIQGRLYVSGDLNERLMRRAINEQRTIDDSVSLLTNRELQVFESIGAGRTVKEIAQTLSLSPKTIETYRDRIRKKLHLDSSTRLMHYAVKWVAEHSQP
ncbi:MAG: response regulator transcription factor [Planctomycetaceae bacterium]|nr:response regulator transcription factor [Planctomycetaceae bacterium]